jgi:uncharacterized protein HemY
MENEKQSIVHISEAAACQIRSVIKLLDVAEETAAGHELSDLFKDISKTRKNSFALLGELAKIASDAKET